MKNPLLYVECFSGVSGDMTVGALLDLGADEKSLINGLESLQLDGYSLKITRVIKNGIEACDFDVILAPKYSKKSGHPFIKRNIFDINQIIERSQITENAKKIAKKITRIVAEAGAKAHHVELNQFYFYESGAIDSIVDIVSTAICLDNLGIENVIVTDLYDGRGFIKTRRGKIPIPVPAVKNIAEKYQLKIRSTEIEGELVTPTGAAIMAAIKTDDYLPENFTIKKIGCGNGKRIYPNEGVLRMYLLEV